jgi:hypothetical protein
MGGGPSSRFEEPLSKSEEAKPKFSRQELLAMLDAQDAAEKVKAAPQEAPQEAP